MYKRAAENILFRRPWRLMSCRAKSSGGAAASNKAGTTNKASASKKVAVTSSAVNSILLRSLKEHYMEVSKMTPPPKVNPPSPFTILKGALDSEGPVLTRTFGNEEISIFVMRLGNMVEEVGGEADDNDDEINQLFLHVSVSKPDQSYAVHFLCGLYPDALGIHSVSMRAKTEMVGYTVMEPNKYNGPVFDLLIVDENVSSPLKTAYFIDIDVGYYNGPVFEDFDEKVRDAFHSYIEERGINESLFPFLQAWLYVKDHRNLMRYFKNVGSFINEEKPTKST